MCGFRFGFYTFEGKIWENALTNLLNMSKTSKIKVLVVLTGKFAELYFMLNLIVNRVRFRAYKLFLSPYENKHMCLYVFSICLYVP